jgi:acyl-coenzyme A synthetase/AMP-(fatty) acid ligase
MKTENGVETGREILNGGAIVDEAARKWGDRTVLYHYESGRSVTYKEVAYMSNRVGNGLRSSGIEIENRVAILMDDCPEWAYIFFGALKIGAVAVPFNTLLTEQDYAFFLSDSRARLLFVGASHLEKVRGALSSLPYLKRVVVCDGNNFGEEGGRVVTWESFIKDAPGALEIERTLSSDVALFVYTSGSTGKPRAIMHGHCWCGENTAYNREVEGLGESDIQFNIPKLYFLVSIGGLISTFDHGSSMVLLSGRPTPMTILELIARYKPTILRGPPTIFVRMVEAIKEAPHLCDLSSVRYIFCSGEALSPELFKRFKETFGIILYNNWGAQETGSAPISWRHGEEVPLEKVGSVGKSPVPGAKVKIVDEHENEVPNGVSGELMVQIRTQFLGYWHEPKNTAFKTSKGWYKPGDSFIRDKEGYYWYLGRQDDMLKVAGRQIFPVEVEHEVSRHPAVLENAVIPVKNEYGLPELHAYVVLKEGCVPSPELATQIQSFVKEGLAPYKRPHRIVFVSELPKTATGKIQRFVLKGQASEVKGEMEGKGG